MLDLSKKYKVLANKQGMPHIGALVHKHIKQNKLNKSDIAKQMRISGSTFQRYTKQISMQVGILWNISHATQYNFLAEIASHLPMPYTSAMEKDLLAQLSERDALIADLQKELAIYKRIVEK